MEIMNIATIILFVVIPLFVLLVTALLGFKRNIFQSGAKLIMTILSIVISAVIVKIGVPTILSDSLDLLNGTTNTDVVAYLQTSGAGQDIIHMASTFIMPLIFFVVFMLIAIVFALLYLIPGRLLSDKAFARRAEKKQSRTTAAVAISSDETGVSSAGNEASHGPTALSQSQKASGNWAKIALRAGSVLCSVFAGFLVLACLATPLNAYSELYTSVSEGLASSIVGEMDASTEEMLNALSSINEHPVNQCYKPFNGILSRYFDHFKTQDGIKVSASDTIASAGAIIDSVSDLGSDSVNSEVFYALADQIEADPFIRGVLSGLVSDMCSAWGRGEAFLGITPPDFGSAAVSNVIFNTLAGCDDIIPALRAVGDTLALQQSMQLNTQDASAMIQQVFNSVNADSAEIIKNIMSKEVLSEISDMPADMAVNISAFVDGVLNGIVEIKENSNLSDTEKADILKREAEALSAFIELTQAPEDINATNLVGAIVDSTVLSNTIQDVTQSGTITDPYSIADILPPEFASDVGTQLVNEGVSEGSDLYNSIMAMISE